MARFEIVLLAFVLFIIVAASFFAIFAGKPPVEQIQEEQKEKTCKTDDDCTNDLGGKKCLLVYPGDFVPFCGCLTNEDCNVGDCGSYNKCS